MSVPDLECHALLDVGCVAVHSAQPVGAHRTGSLALRTVHPEVDHQRVLVSEEFWQTDLETLLILEPVVLGDHRSGRQRLTLRHDACHVTAKLDLFGEERTAGLLVRG